MADTIDTSSVDTSSVDTSSIDTSSIDTSSVRGSSIRIVHGVCPHDCPDSCGWQVTVQDGRAVQMRGHPDHPYSAGELCPKVNKYLDRVYHPDRVLHPMRRVGRKGDARFEQISWDEALSTIATRLHADIDRFGAESIVPYSSAGNQSTLAHDFSERFWNRLGGSRLARSICGTAAGAGVEMTMGTGLGLDALELVHSKLILIWGTNTKLTNRHLWPTVEAARANGARIVVIDPLRTVTAEAADWFLQPLPGTDVAVMLAMMHVLIAEDLIDTAWIDAHTTGFADLAAAVAPWTPQRAAAATGLDATDIAELARQYGTVRPAAIRTLIGAEHHENGAMFFRTLACLPALVGAWQDRGGGLSRSVGSWNGLLKDRAAIARPDLRRGPLPRQLNMNHLGRDLTNPDLDPPISSILLWNSNPLVSTPNVEAIRRGLSREDLFLVVHEQFVTDTARYADILLPATTQIETVDVNPAWGHLWTTWNEPAITPQGASVSNPELHRRLAAAMGFTEPALFDDDLTVLRDAFPTVDLCELRSVGWVRAPYPDSGMPHADGTFPTADGRLMLTNPALASIGQPVLPTYVAPSEAPGQAGTPRFPLALLTPKHHQRFLNSGYAHLPNHGGREGTPYVELCAADAEARSLVDGQEAEVFNDRGCVHLPVRVTRRVRPGVVAIPWGWWGAHHPNGQVANSLTNDTLTEWGGGVAFADTLVEVRPA